MEKEIRSFGVYTDMGDIVVEQKREGKKVDYILIDYESVDILINWLQEAQEEIADAIAKINLTKK